MSADCLYYVGGSSNWMEALATKPGMTTKSKRSHRGDSKWGCDVCFSDAQRDGMLGCEKCGNVTHVWCCSEIRLRVDVKRCCNCRSTSTWDGSMRKKYVNIRSGGSSQSGTEIRVLGVGWVSLEKVTANDPAFAKWHHESSSPLLKLLSVRGRRRNLVAAPSWEPIPHSLPVVRDFQFATNGAPFGVLQFRQLFTDARLSELEASVIGCLRTLDELEHHRTVDISKNLGRSKLFFGYRYQYGGGRPGMQNSVFTDVDPIPDWLQATIQELVELGVVLEGWGNQVVVNVYHSSAPGLGVHRDAEELFDRPVVSLRLFEPAILSFGCTGQGMVPVDDAFVQVPQVRGDVTLMDGFAANCTNHCVRQADLCKPSVSLLFRHVKEQAPCNRREEPLTDDQLQQNKRNLLHVQRCIQDDASIAKVRCWAVADYVAVRRNGGVCPAVIVSPDDPVIPANLRQQARRSEFVFRLGNQAWCGAASDIVGDFFEHFEGPWENEMFSSLLNVNGGNGSASASLGGGGASRGTRNRPRRCHRGRRHVL